MSITKKTDKKGRSMYRFETRYKTAAGTTARKSSRWYETKKEAKAAEAAFRAKAEGGMPNEEVLFETVWLDWVDYSRDQAHNAPKTVHEKTAFVNLYFSPLKAKPIESIKPAQIRKLFGKIQVKAGRKNKFLLWLRLIFRFSKRYYGTKNNPCEDMDSFTDAQDVKGKKEAATYTPDEFARFIAQMDPDDDFTYLFQWIYWLGFRRAEAMSLTFEDVQDGVVHCWRQYDQKYHCWRGLKNKSSVRYIRLPQALLEMYKSQRAKYESIPGFKESWFIFGGPQILAETTMDRRRRAAIEAAGLPYITNHQLRHSYASNMLAVQENAWLVARSMGHANPDMTTSVYGHVRVSDLACDIEEMIKSCDNRATIH